MLLTVQAISTIANAVYTAEEIRRIVANTIISQFHGDQQNPGRQYAVLMVLPTNRDQLDPQPPRIMVGHLLVGNNYVVARPDAQATDAAGRRRHTEKLVLDKLLNILNHYVWTTPPAVVLYTRGTPCAGCTQAIINSFNAAWQKFPKMQVFVTYSTNIVNGYMNLEINCKTRNGLRKLGMIVMCVNEPGEPKQCREDDSVPCFRHPNRYRLRWPSTILNR